MNNKVKTNGVEILEISGICNIVSPTDLNPLASDKKRPLQYLKYDFVLNNYANDRMEILERFLHKFTKAFVFQEEVSESGTPHLQGAIWLKKKARILELTKIPEFSRMSFRKCRHWPSLIRYCQETIEQKDFGRLPNGKVFRYNVNKIKSIIKIINYDKLYKWELNILDILNKLPDDRIIYWYYEETGGVGKTTFCKYLAVTKNAIILSGKASDMKYGITKYIEKFGDYPEIIILDIPRSRKDYLSYNGIECIKNGLFYSTKYESCMVIGNCPHLLVFANFEPDRQMMSLDRWKIILIPRRNDGAGVLGW